MRKTLAPVAIAALVGATALSGCSLLGLGGDSVEDMQMTVGECISDPDIAAEGETEVGALPVVDCAEPHYGEVYFVEELTDDEYPAVSIRNTADDLCLEAYEPFIGTTYDQSAYYITSITPSLDTWEAGDRQVACLVVGDESEGLTGSLKGAEA